MAKARAQRKQSKQQPEPMSRKRLALITAVVFFIGGIVAFIVYANNYAHATQEALDAMESTETVSVQELQGAGWGFLPAQVEAATDAAADTTATDAAADATAADTTANSNANASITGIVFYPGAKVEAKAYAPLMQALAEEGYVCVLMEMPLNMAVLDIDAAERGIGLYPEVDTWYIAGHSMGGAMGATYAVRHAGQVEGLILLAAYSNDDLSQSGLRVLSVYGSEDGVLNHDNYQQDLANLPSGYTEDVLQGGNHSNFGNYGLQGGDNEGTLTAEQQQAATVQDISAFLAAA